MNELQDENRFYVKEACDVWTGNPNEILCDYLYMYLPYKLASPWKINNFKEFKKPIDAT